MNVVGSIWVFKLKRKHDGSTHQYKAQLVAKGFNQTLGIDYKETFSLVIKPCTIRLVLYIAIKNNWSIK